MITAIFLLTSLIAIATSLPLEEETTVLSTTDETPFRWNAEIYPNPKTTFTECGRWHSSFVCDPEHILTREQADSLDHLLGLIRNDTFCFCSQCLPGGPRGITISVALVNGVFRKFHHEVAEAVKHFAEYLRKAWNFGTCDDDMVIVIATEDQQASISSGEKAKQAINAQEMDRIFLETKTYFQNNDYYQGLESIVQSFYDVLRNNVQQSSQVDQQGGDVSESSVGLAVGLVVGFVVLGATLGFVIVVIRRRRAAAESRKPKHYRRDSPPRPIVKKTVDFFPATPYQPCEIDDNENDTKSHVNSRGAKELSMVVEEESTELQPPVSQPEENHHRDPKV